MGMQVFVRGSGAEGARHEGTGEEGEEEGIAGGAEEDRGCEEGGGGGGEEGAVIRLRGKNGRIDGG